MSLPNCKVYATTGDRDEQLSSDPLATRRNLRFLAP